MLLTASMAFAGEYSGRYCSGKGNVGYLRLIDQSFEFFHPNPYRQNISMLYIGKEERLCENMSWYMWWVQNSYGPTFCSLPYLKEPWITALQNAQDLWFKFQGDGVSVRGFPPEPAPDGSLCDCAGPNTVIYKQGDMDTSLHKLHDWFYEGAAAGVVMQAELLLISRDTEAIKHYIGMLDRACNFVESTRDPKNNLFLVGCGANLLAPSYGGIKMPDGTFGKGYLAGLSVNYLAAADRMVELYKLLGDKKKAALYEHRRRITRDSLKLLLTKDGYFVKSLERGGIRHGVIGQREFGYFEVAPNVDSVCFRGVSDPLARRIVSRIASIPELRPHGMLITNYPSLDDIYIDGESQSDASKAVRKLTEYGRWVNGGVWTTMEARAVMAYYRTGRYDYILRSAQATLDFARQFQMDAPLPNFGKSVWFEGNSTNLCYDTLGVPAAVARGLFEYVYTAESLALYPHIHPSITEYVQTEPIRFGAKRVTITVANGGPSIKSLRINGKPAPVAGPDHVVLPYAQLPSEARVEIVTAGKWPSDVAAADASFVQPDPAPPTTPGELPPDMAAHLKTLTTMRGKIANEPGAGYERAFLAEAVGAYEAYRSRAGMHGAGHYADLSAEKRTGVLNWYRQAAEEMYVGFETLMNRYAAAADAGQAEIAKLFEQVKSEQIAQ